MVDCRVGSRYIIHKRRLSSIIFASPTGTELTAQVKVKFSHTRYRALGPELIPVYAGDVK